MFYRERRFISFAECTSSVGLDLPFAAFLRNLGSKAAHSTHGRMERIASDGSGEEGLWKRPTEEATLDNFQDHWTDMVDVYTKCQMTHPKKDRLTAITGMMKSITDRTEQHFVHGLIASRLPMELLWYQWVRCDGDESIRHVSIGHAIRCPTWSRVSVQSFIQPFWAHRVLQLQRRVSWQVEIETILGDLDQNLTSRVT